MYNFKTLEAKLDAITELIADISIVEYLEVAMTIKEFSSLREEVSYIISSLEEIQSELLQPDNFSPVDEEQTAV